MAPAPAAAGAWVAPEGGQEIWTSFFGEAENGDSYYETALYYERPLDPGTSLVVSPWVMRDPLHEDGFRGEATLALKGVFHRSEDWVLAAQGGAAWVSDAEPGCGATGAELRLLAGRSFDNGSFFNAEIASRQMPGGCSGERLDLTVGARPAHNWLALGQVFVDAPSDGDEIVRAQVSLVRFRANGAGIQIGVRSRIDGGPAETAVMISLWDYRGD